MSTTYAEYAPTLEHAPYVNAQGDGISGRELERAVEAMERGEVARLVRLGRKTERERKAN